MFEYILSTCTCIRVNRSENGSSGMENDLIIHTATLALSHFLFHVKLKMILLETIRGGGPVGGVQRCHEKSETTGGGTEREASLILLIHIQLT